jgi:hypothetical protein
MLKLLDKLMVRLNRKRLVYDRVDGELYLTRYYLFLKERTKCPFNIFLHRFHKSDDEVLHDHPWPFATLILRGGYWEWRPQFNAQGQKIGEIAKWCGPGSFRTASATTYHRIELDPAVTCWTLFMPGPKQRDWGFLVRNVWVQWEQYLKQRKAT